MQNAFRNGTLFIFLFILSLGINAQPVGYYKGVESKSGEALKQVLNEKISGHVDFSYSFAKHIINYSDSDPENSDNVILFYLQQSRNADNYGTGGDNINREHVWAKSHGNFADIRPMDSDAHNLRPADASVNVDRSNKDFDKVQSIGTQHSEATDCWYTSSAWEPGDATKGQVARILFYMATRYEGEDEEMDLEVVDELFTAGKKEHGKLSTLLEWNKQYPPSDFERRRNERLFRIQQNRNPFVDHPEFADFIWGAESPSGPAFSNYKMNPEIPAIGEQLSVSIDVSAENELGDVKLYWGSTFQSTDNETLMGKSESNYSTIIQPEGFQAGDMIYFSVQTTFSDSTYTWNASYIFPEAINENDLTSIPDVQGTGSASPMDNQEVTISGRVVGNFDNSFFLQSSDLEYGGMNVYNTFFRGKVGDSLIVKGTVDEYNNLTEILDVSYIYNYKDNKDVEPIVITTADFDEKYEGMLVTVKGVSVSGAGNIIPEENTTYTFNDHLGSGKMFISYSSRLVGKIMPSDDVEITGIFSQYKDTYQILPRNINDINFSTGSDDIMIAQNHVTLYPNPVSDWLYFDSKEKISKLNLYNIGGQMVLSKNLSLNKVSLNLLKEGVYFIELISERGDVFQKKIVKIN